MPEGFELKTYVCGNKDSVYFYHQDLGERSLPTQPLLFFVDKNIDELLLEAKAASDKIYVTDVTNNAKLSHPNG